MSARPWFARSPNPPSPACNKKRLCFEPLEGREVPATFIANNFDDVHVAGKLSLREAVSLANATSEADTIVLLAGTYNQTLPGIDDTNAGGDFDVTGSLTIVGAGPGVTVIKGNHNDRLFDVLGPINVAFSSLTLRDGGNPLFDGGAVQALSGNITLTNSVATANAGRFGGAIHDDSGAVTVRTSRLSDNLAGGISVGGGGAIDIGSGSLFLDRSTVSGNFTSDKGGGILAGTGTVTLSQCTVKLNTSGSSGGGIDSEDGTFTLTGSSIRRNQATGDGGGIFALGGGAVLTNSSVTGNRSLGGAGGGISATLANLTGSTVSGNSSHLFGGGISALRVILTDSHVNTNIAQGDGGGVFSRGPVSLHSSSVIGNQAVDGSGGGINATANVALDRSTVSGNTSKLFGGGICTVSMTALNSTISDNTCQGPGGGISAELTANVLNSTVSGNVAGGQGGGISADTVNLSNATISGNTAGTLSNFTGQSGEGGGVIAAHGTILNCTIVENRTTGSHSNGGAGVRSLGGSVDPLRVQNTIIAENFNPFGPEQDVFGAFVSNGHNLIGEIDGDSTGFGAPGDQMGAFNDPLDPQLGELANNGGPTKTHALLAGSPAIDRGDNTGAPATDQRGVLRPRDGDGNGLAVTDIGAFER